MADLDRQLDLNQLRDMLLRESLGKALLDGGLCPFLESTSTLLLPPSFLQSLSDTDGRLGALQKSPRPSVLNWAEPTS